MQTSPIQHIPTINLVPTYRADANKFPKEYYQRREGKINYLKLKLTKLRDKYQH